METHEEQEEFIGSNLKCFADAFVWLETSGNKPILLGVYDGNIPIGLTMISYNTADEHGVEGLDESLYYICRFMIDKNYQGKGYGKAALAQIIELVRAEKPLGQAGWLYVSVHKGNPATQLYQSVGFTETGDGNGLENDMRMRI
ncbi:MAG: GNAT family N-acetyltransferase [Defluviitaleaceae bacterium]|nr:GNAT family N-acetyltransferase [Defluviitaleaceae bacterium]